VGLRDGVHPSARLPRRSTVTPAKRASTDKIDLFAMTVGHDLTHRGSSQTINAMALEDRFEVLKEIGDGSFGSVVLARVRSAGSSVARRGTVVSSSF
jgi:hypothetical protein